jgi:hypothetical protein
MFRIDDATAATSLPIPEAAGSEGFFTEGNPVAGTPATNVRGSWLNMIQEELRAIVVAGGLAPSKTAYNQVLTALQSLFAGQITGTTSYVKVPVVLAGVEKNLIVQWGTTSLASGINSAVQVLPVSWPTGYLGGVASDTGSVCSPCGVNSNGLNQINLYTSPFNVSVGSIVAHSIILCGWIVIGY